MPSLAVFMDLGATQAKLLALHPDTPPRLVAVKSVEMGTQKSDSKKRAERLREELGSFLSQIKADLSSLTLILKGPRSITQCFLLPHSSSWSQMIQEAQSKILDTSGLSSDSTETFVTPLKIPATVFKNQILVKTTAIAKPVLEESRQFLAALSPGKASLYSINDALAGLARLSPDFDEQKITGILRISNTTTTLCLCQYGNPLMSRTIPTGGQNFTRVLMGEMVFEGVTFTTSLDEAEEIKEKQGLTLDEADFEVKGPVKLPPELSNALLSPLLESLTTEIKRFLTFAKNELRFEKVDTIHLIGSGARLLHLDLHFEKTFQVPVKRLKIANFLQYESGLTPLDFEPVEDLYVHLVGIAANPEKTDFLKKEPWTRFVKTWIDKYYAVIFFCLLICCFGLLEGYNQHLKREGNRLEDQWSEKVLKYTHYFEIQSEKRQYLSTLAGIFEQKKKHLPWLGFFKELSRKKPAGISLTKVHILSSDDFHLSPPYSCLLEGQALMPDDSSRPERLISQFIDRLNASPWVAKTELLSVSSSPGGSGSSKIKLFNLKCQIKTLP